MISKLQLNKSSIISKAENEKGIVLISAKYHTLWYTCYK